MTRRTLVSRWGNAQGDYVLGLYEGEPWTRIWEQEMSPNGGTARMFGDPGFARLSDTDFLLGYSTQPSTSNYQQWLARASVASGALVVGTPQPFAPAFVNTNGYKRYPTVNDIAGANGGMGECRFVTTTADGLYVVAYPDMPGTSYTWYREVFSLDPTTGATSLLHSETIPTQARVLPLSGNQHLEVPYFSGTGASPTLTVRSVNPDGTTTVVASGSYPPNAQSDGSYDYPDFFYLSEFDLIVAIGYDFTYPPPYGVSVSACSPSDMVWSTPSRVSLGWTNAILISAWISWTPGGALLGYVEEESDGFGGGTGNVWRCVVPVTFDGPHATCGTPVKLIDAVTQNGPMTPPRGPYALRTWTTPNGDFYIYDDNTSQPLFAGPASISGATSPGEYEPSVPQYTINRALALATDAGSSLSGTAAVRFKRGIRR